MKTILAMFFIFFAFTVMIPTVMGETTGVDTKQEEIREDRTKEILQCGEWHSQYQTDSLDNFMTLKDVRHAQMCIMLYNDSIWDYDGEDRIVKLVEYSLIPQSRSSTPSDMISSGSVTVSNSDTTSRGSIKVSDSDAKVSYEITTGKIVNIAPDIDLRSLMVLIDTNNAGTITLELPRTVVDAKANDGNSDDEFFVLVDGEEVSFEESITQTHRNLAITFPSGAEEIEIVGTFVIPEFGTIAMMILSISIISIIAVSSKSRLSLIPRH